MEMASHAGENRRALANVGVREGVAMDTTRRQFLTGLGLTGAAVGSGLDDPRPAEAARIPAPKTAGATETTTVCPFCGVGCGQVVSVKDGRVVSIEGDPAHPINEGTLCSKGAAAAQVSSNPLRLTTPRYRAPGSDRWEEKSWDWMTARIAERVKATRDATFQLEADGRVVNRTEAIASLGGAALDNEECYLLSKLMRALGIVYLEHQARI
jgi:formate dehydrogenase major subunit